MLCLISNVYIVCLILLISQFIYEKRGYIVIPQRELLLRNSNQQLKYLLISGIIVTKRHCDQRDSVSQVYEMIFQQLACFKSVILYLRPSVSNHKARVLIFYFLIYLNKFINRQIARGKHLLLSILPFGHSLHALFCLYC